MQGKKFWIGAVSIVFAIAIVVTGLLLHERQQLEEIRNTALEELERNAGQYDEQSIVLYNTSKAKAEELAERYGAELRITENGRFATLTLPEGTTIRDVYAMDESLKYIQDMSADYHVQISNLTETEEDGERLPMRPQYSVTDEDYELQNYLDYLNMGSVWESYRGYGITIAVIDTGIDTDHPEFAGRISEYSYNATEDKIVKDWLTEDGSYDWSLIEDEQGHGTAVTGVLAASMDGNGVVGIAPNVNIIVIKAECDAAGNFKRTSDLIFGLYYAIERDVNVVNMSFGTYGLINPFAEATQLAYDSDIICVAAAGNKATSALCWPAADEKVIGVGALGDGWTLAEYSNYGENTDLVAPGNIYTTLMGGQYGTMNGTSLASPVVAGSIALFLQNNSYVTFEDVTEVLYASSYDLGDLGHDWYYGFGALDVSAFILEERGTIIYDMLTDELENEEGIFIQGHTLQELPEPERLYAVFDGWYYDDTFTQEYNYYEDKFYGEVTLYAKWVNEEDGVPYTYVVLDDGTVQIRSYTGHRRYITIPEKIDGRIVSSIGDFAFSGQTRLREVTLPSGLNHIGLYAFQNCANLVSIHIPANVTEIEEGAFFGNVRLSTVAFLGSSKLQTIGDFAFQDCGRLERIELPVSVRNLNGSAFFGATALHSIVVQAGNTSFSSKEGVLFNYSGSTLVAFPAAWGSSYVLPENTVYIGDYAFGYAKLSQVDLYNVQTIGASSFAYAALQTLTIPDSVTSMGREAFSCNSSLSHLNIGRGLTQISVLAFSDTVSLKTVTIPDGITEIGGGAFSYSGLQSVIFESNSRLAYIGTNAFEGCNLSEIDIPASVLKIGDWAFTSNPLLRVEFAENAALHFIGEGAFENCQMLDTIALPASLRTIGDFAFQSSGLTEVTVPAGVTTLGDGAFSRCADLSAVTVEKGNAVYHDIDGVVYTLDNLTIHTYPAGKAGENYTLETTTQIVAPWAFAGAVNLMTVELPESLVQISEYGFAYCKNMQYIHIPDNVLQIGRYSFAYDWNLYSVSFNETSKLPRISFGAFAYSGLTSFTVPSNVSTMAQKAFEGCVNLTSITFAENSKLESISAYMFDGGNNLQSITFLPGSALTSIQAHGLEGMDRLMYIDFGDAKLTNIDNFAFRFCESLYTLDLPETVTNIGRYAFYGCKSLSELAIPGDMEHIGSYAFLGTNELNLYFANEELPAYLDENWDHGTRGYYVGVTSVVEDGDYRYAILESGNIAIIEYLGNAAAVDLTTLNFGAPITQIGGSAFKDSAVKSIVLPDTLTSIQAEAFAYSNLTSIVIPANVTFIGREAFAHTDITTLTFAAGSKLTVMEQYAFEGTKNLKSVTLPASLTTMGTGVFLESGLTSVIFESGIRITEIPQKAFAETKLISVTLPDSVTLVNHNAFNNVQTLKSVTFGNNEGIRLMSNAFYHTGLEELHIPANVTYIGEYCFVALPNLQAFSVDANNPNYTAVDGLLLTKSGRKLIAVPAGRTGSLMVPGGVEEIGFGAFEESKLSEILFHPDANILTFGYRAFFKAENITEITIPQSVVSVDYYAFAYCENLQTVIFAEDNQLKGIYEGAFLGCINLENIVTPDSIVEISDFAFYGCSKIDQLPISENNNIKGIYDYAFAYTGLNGEFTTPETLIDIGNYAFLGTKLTKVTIPDANKKDLIIGIGAFEECNEMIEITLPFIGASYEDEEISWFGYIFGAGTYEANETYIPESLKTVTLTDGITTIFTGGFAYCTSLETVDVPHSVSVLWNDAFKDTTARYELTNVITTYWYDEWTKRIYTEIHIGHFGKGVYGNLVLAEGLTKIPDYSFSKCENLLGIIIPTGVATIGYRAFYGCAQLTHIILPNGLTTIDGYAFYMCENLIDIEIPNTVVSLGEFAFSQCKSLLKVTIPDNITEIQQRTFETCSKLQSVVIGTGVKTVGEGAFMSCINLREITNKSDLSLVLNSDDYGCLTLFAKVIIDKQGNRFYKDENSKFEYIDTADGFRFAKEDEEYTLISYTGVDDTVELPRSIDGHAYSIYHLSGIKNVIIPEGITAISDYAFSGCTSLTSIIVPDSVVSIGSCAFYGCSGLEKIVLSNNLKSIGGQAFYGCSSLVDITLPDGITTLDYGAFSGCTTLTSIILPDGLSYIAQELFKDCTGLVDVVIPESVKAIYDRAFYGCINLTSIEIPKYVYLIDRLAFYGCNNLSKIFIPNNVSSIGTQAFPQDTEIVFSQDNMYFQAIDGIVYDKELTRIIYVTDSVSSHIILPDTLCKIEYGQFANCNNIESIVIPDSITEIDVEGFANCSKLKSVIIGNGVKIIWDRAFKNCTSLTYISMGSAVKSIRSDAFQGCNELKQAILPDGITTIAMGTFDGCSSLEYIYIPDSVNAILGGAFSNCSSLESITIPDGVTSIGARTFENCVNLKNIVLSDNAGLKYIDGVLYDNPVANILWVSNYVAEELRILDGVTTIGDWQFSHCVNMEKVVIPNSVTRIGDGAFRGCSKLVDVTMHDGLISIGEYAFTSTNIMSIYIPKSVEKIGYGAFLGCDKLYEVYNFSSLDFTFASDDHGYVAWCAKVIIDENGNRHYKNSETGFEFIDTVDGFRFAKEGDKYSLVAYTGKDDTVVLPLSVDGHTYSIDMLRGVKNIILPDGFTSINNYAFYGNDELISIDIPESVTYIGNSAFQGCHSLDEIVLPSKLMFIGAHAFTDCKSLKGVDIPSSVITIEWYAFYNCASLANVMIQEGIQSIEAYTFQNCSNLRKVAIPNSVTSIGHSAFHGCSGLYENADYYQNGMLVIDNWLVDVGEGAKYLTNAKSVLGVIGGAYDNCYLLKDAVWGNTALPSNVETVYITNINQMTPCLQNTLTLKNVVICESVSASDWRYCEWLFRMNNVTGVTIYVEALEADLRWDDNFPDWNNGNVVVYGDKWNYVEFYDADGNLLISEPKRNAEIIRRPVVQLPANTESDRYELLGWDLDGDGIADSIPATTTTDIRATAIVQKIHAHYYNAVVTAPTCVDKGYTTHTCACGDSYIDSYVDALGHKYGEWYETKAPTCIEQGEERHNCIRCDHFETQAVVAVGHDYVAVVTKPTCTERGYTTHTCACGDSYIDSYVDATGHKDGNTDHICDNGCGVYQGTHADGSDKDHLCDYGCGEALSEHQYNVEVTKPTCTEQGYTTYTCHCGDTYVDSYVNALGHKDGNKDHICDNGCGVYQGTHADGADKDHLCDYGCGETLSEHQYNAEVTKPTCTERGYTTHTCACGDSYIDSYVDATGHKDGNTDHICDNGCGVYQGTHADGSDKDHLCDYGCGEALSEHQYNAVVTKPTCAEQGYTTHTCACGDSYIDGYVDALGHKYGEWHETIEPGCTTEGEQRHDCIRCDHFETQAVVAVGHDYVAVVTKPTCTEQGYTIHTCHCGDTYVDSYVNALGHKDGNKDHICDNGCGDYQGIHADGADKDHLCDYGCGEALSEHQYNAEVTKPTCTERGYTTHTCACGDSYIDSYVDATGHKDGNKDHICDNGCGVYQGTHVDGSDEDHLCDYGCGETLSEHQYNAVVTKPTCTEQGYTTYTCHCGDTYVDAYVTALGHKDGNKDHICDNGCGVYQGTHADGADKDHLCDYGCGATLSEHQYNAEVTKPTCTEQGYTAYTCACGDSYVDSYVDALGHAYSAVVAKPTCTAQGYTTHTCHCGDTYVDSYVNALGHKDVNKDHICDNGCGVYQGTHADGADKDHFCDYGCGENLSEHQYNAVVTKPTCTESGYTTYTCACGHTYKADATNALGHSFTHYISDNNATTEADGTKTAVCDRGCGAKDTVVDKGSQIVVSEITSDVYRVTEDYISKIAVGTTVEQLLSNLKDQEYIQIFKDGVLVEADKLLGTGMIVRLTVNGTVMQEVEVVVTGDTNGDGKISITDMVAIKSHVLQNSTLEGASAMAADTSGDGKISITDFIQIKAHILGKGDVTPVAEVKLETKTVVYEATEAEHVQETDVIETKVVEETAERAEITKEQTTIICSVCREFLVPGKATSLGLWNYHKERYV